MKQFNARGAALHLAWLLAAACVTGSSPPAVSPTSTLGPTLGAQAAPQASHFALVFAGPQGPTSTNAQINLVFNKPLRALSGDEQPPQIPVTVTPPAAGQWQWLGTHAVSFVPQGGQFAPATHFVVTVPQMLTDQGGETLAKTTEFAFETPLPTVQSSDPSQGQKGVLLNQPIVLSFNQAVSPSEIERVGELVLVRGKTEQKLAFKAKRTKMDQPSVATLIANSPLPKASHVRLRLPAGFRGEGGVLPSQQPFQVDFETFGPMKVSQFQCNSKTNKGRCRPGAPVSLSFSNAAHFADIKHAIQITPSVPLNWADWWEANDAVSDLELSGPFKPDVTYQVQISAELRDQFGQALGPSAPFSFTVGDFESQVELGIEGTVVPSFSAAHFDVGSVNAGNFQFVSTPLNPSTALDMLHAEGDPFRILAAIPHSVTQTFKSGPRNQMTRQAVDLGARLAASAGRGLLGVGVRYRNESGHEQTISRLLNVTNLGLTAKVSPFGSLVWVTDLATAQPVAAAEVELFGKNPAISKKFRTDAAGLVTISAADFTPQFEDYSAKQDTLVIARSGADWTYRALDDFIRPWRMDVPMDLARNVHEYGMLFTERGLYRPGDTLQVKGVIRQEAATGNLIPQGKTFTLVLISPSGEEITKKAVKLSEYGSLATEFRVPETGELGSWRIDTQGITGGHASTDFQVAEYRPAEFKATVQVAQKSALQGTVAHFDVRGDYLYGAPMSGATVSYSITRQSAWFTPPGSDSFIVNDVAYRQDEDERSLDGTVLGRQTAKLDAQGHLAIDTTLTLPNQVGPERVSLEAQISDLSRQEQSASAALLVHPASFYLGLEAPQDWFVNAPGNFVPKVVALSIDGQHLSGKQLELSLIRRRWTLVREQTADGVETKSQVIDTPVSRCTITSKQELASCSLPLTQSGYYVLFAKSKDERGRPVQSALSFYAIGEGSPTWKDDNTQHLELALNKKQYNVGDVARVLVKSPYPEAEALITVERAGIYQTKRVHLQGPTPTLDVLISKEMQPNAFVSVHLLKGGSGASLGASAAKQTVTAPAYRIGYAELRINPEARRLSVKVTPDAAQKRPGDNVQVTLQVQNKQGQGEAAEVTLFAVDEGVLSLVGYKTPDLLPVFTAARPLQVATLESRDALAVIGLRDLTSLLGNEKGAEGGGGGEARSDFRQSAYFNPSVITDAAGRASVSFKLPESLTTYRLMAVAVSKGDRYGFGESHVTTSKPLMLRPALPRFLRAGDRFEASVIVAANQFGPSSVTVSADFQGVTLKDQSTKTMNISKGGSVELRFSAIADQVGQARLRFRAKAGQTTDAVELTREIKSPSPLEAVALYGQTDKTEGQALGDLKALRSDQGGLQITLASSALVGLDGGIDQLLNYPYACTEQLASRLLPLLPLRTLATRYNLKLPDHNDKLASTTLAAILKRQRGDGGFGLWPDSESSLPWVSSYALWVAHLAQQAGNVAVPAAVFQRGKAYLRQQMSRIDSQSVTLAEGAFMLMVLGELGDPDSGYLNNLFNARERMPLFGRALLLRTAVKSKASSEMLQTLQRDLEGHIALDGNRATIQQQSVGDEMMDSKLRTHAQVLWALLTADPAFKLATPLARTLLAGREGGTWHNTQETAFCLLALAQYAAAQEAQPPNFVAKIWFGKDELNETLFSASSNPSVSTWVPMSKLGGSTTNTSSATNTSGATNLVFQKEGTGTLFYEARLKYAQKTLPTTDLDRGFYLRHTLRRVDPASLEDAQKVVPELGMTQFNGSDLVLADVVVVTASARKFVVIDDPLPAGFEAIDTQLATTAQSLSTSDVPINSAYQSSWFRTELHDDRALFFVDDMPAGMYHYRFLARATSIGQFVVPPAQVFEMYQPEVSGRTAATQVEIH